MQFPVCIKPCWSNFVNAWLNYVLIVLQALRCHQLGNPGRGQQVDSLDFSFRCLVGLCCHRHYSFEVIFHCWMDIFGKCELGKHSLLRDNFFIVHDRLPSQVGGCCLQKLDGGMTPRHASLKRTESIETFPNHLLLPQAAYEMYKSYPCPSETKSNEVKDRICSKKSGNVLEEADFPLLGFL